MGGCGEWLGWLGRAEMRSCRRREGGRLLDRMNTFLSGVGKVVDRWILPVERGDELVLENPGDVVKVEKYL